MSSNIQEVTFNPLHFMTYYIRYICHINVLQKMLPLLLFTWAHVNHQLGKIHDDFRGTSYASKWINLRHRLLVENHQARGILWPERGSKSIPTYREKKTRTCKTQHGSAGCSVPLSCCWHHVFLPFQTFMCSSLSWILCLVFDIHCFFTVFSFSDFRLWISPHRRGRCARRSKRRAASRGTNPWDRAMSVSMSVSTHKFNLW